MLILSWQAYFVRRSEHVARFEHLSMFILVNTVVRLGVLAVMLSGASVVEMAFLLPRLVAQALCDFLISVLEFAEPDG